MNRENSYYLNMKRTVLKIEKYIISQLKDTEHNNLTVSELSIIDAIGIDGEKTITQIADTLEVTLSTPTKAMDRLVAKGYIVRETSNKDRRVVLTKLTSKGNDVAMKLLKYRKKLLEEFFENLKDDDVKKFNKILTCITEVLDYKKGDTND